MLEKIGIDVEVSLSIMKRPDDDTLIPHEIVSILNEPDR
jgi:hypothetical protein